MNSEWLQAFVVSAQARSLEEAAALLKTTQPTLTRQLKSLEQALGVTLFSMQGRRKVLTQIGEDLYRELQPRFVGINESVDRVLRHQSQSENIKIRIGARREILASLAPALRFPGHLKFEFIGHTEIVKRLLERTLDIGITHKLPDSLHLAAFPLFRDDVKICWPTSWNLPAGSVKKTITLLAAKYPYLAYDQIWSLGAHVLERMEIPQHSVRVARMCPDWGVIMSLVNAGIGWSVIPGRNAIESKNAVIESVPKDLERYNQFHLIYLKELAGRPWFEEIRREFQQK